MYELVQLGENSYYIQSPTNIGLVKLNEIDVCIIDSGNDKEAGRKVRQILDSKGWNLKAIYNTHSHADHIGGNAYLQNQTDCKIYASGIECDFTRHTILGSAFIYGGLPPSELQHKVLKAQESKAEFLTQEVLPNGFEIIELPGHSFNMIGIRTADDVVYLGDSISSKETLEKYQIVFIYDVEAYINTLEKIKTMEAKCFVPSHAKATDNISQLAQLNIDNVYSVADAIVKICDKPISFEQILKKIFDIYHIPMSIVQHEVIGSTIKSYLTWLKAQGRLDIIFDNNMLLWIQK